jgi:hypothetical protein
LSKELLLVREVSNPNLPQSIGGMLLCNSKVSGILFDPTRNETGKTPK